MLAKPSVQIIGDGDDAIKVSAVKGSILDSMSNGLFDIQGCNNGNNSIEISAEQSILSASGQYGVGVVLVHTGGGNDSIKISAIHCVI